MFRLIAFLFLVFASFGSLCSAVNFSEASKLLVVLDHNDANVKSLIKNLETKTVTSEREKLDLFEESMQIGLQKFGYYEFYERVRSSNLRGSGWIFTWFEPYGAIFKSQESDELTGYILFNETRQNSTVFSIEHSNSAYQYAFKFNQDVFSILENHSGSYGIWHTVEEKFRVELGCWRRIGIEWQGSKSEALLQYGEELERLPIGFDYKVSINELTGSVFAKNEQGAQIKKRIATEVYCLN